jgi:phosphoribosyl 1,2-cyclic phosphodiesterase
MTELKACALRSGSSGNAIFISSGKTRLLVDAGVCLRSIEQALEEIDEKAGQLNGILITHEHSDHVSGLGVLLRRHPIPLYLTRGTWQAIQCSIGQGVASQVHLIEDKKPSIIGDMMVASFKIPHDAAEPVGFRIQSSQGDVAVFTDAGHLEDQMLAEVAGCKIIFVEANYDQAMLLAGTYPAMLKQRILSEYGHLSNDDCATAVCRLLSGGTEHFVLSHISKDNNYPELALLTVSSKLREIGARPGHDCRLSVARRFSVSEPVCF